MNKFEKLIEYIINDEDQKARELFHTIVVEKSRDIYESIMDEEQMEETIPGEQVKDLTNELSDEEAMGEAEGEEDFGGEEPAADFGDEEGSEEFGSEEGEAEEHEEIEDKVMNIDAKLDELLAKFDEIMGDDGHGDEMGGEEPAMDMGHDEMGGEEVPAEEEPAMFEGENPFAKSGKSGKSGSAQSGKSGSAKSGKSGKSGSGKMESRKGTTELMREYVDRIGDIYGGQGDAAEGDAVGAAGKKTSVNTKPGSIGPGNDFGGTPVKATGPTSNQDGTTPTKASNEYNKGQGEIKSGNRNVPGGKADKLETTGKEYSKENGAEGQTTDGKVAVAKKSVQVQNTGKK
jgi:hypothetical protein